MAVSKYYGLKKVSDDSILEMGWSSLPVANQYAGGQYYIYMFKNSSVPGGVGFSDGSSQFTTGYITIESGTYQRWIKYYGKTTGASTEGEWGFSKVKSVAYGGAPLTKQYAVGDTVYMLRPDSTYNAASGGGVGSGIAWDNWKSDTANVYRICEYWKFTISASTNPVSNNQVGNIALYNGNTLLVGESAKNKKGVTSFNYTFTSESSSASLKFVATALTGVSNLSPWHNKYFFDGITKDGDDIRDSDISFTQDTATYQFTLSENSSSVTFNVNYGKKFSLVIGTLPAGVSSTTVSYSRHHSTGDYVSASTSPISLSGAGTLYVEDGSAVNFSAQASAGYVFTNSTGFWSQVDDDYNVFGNGTNAISRTPGLALMLKDHSYALTVTSYQISVSISDESKNDWGTVYIDNDNPRVTSKRLVQGTTYNFNFESSKNETVAPVVDYWTVNGQRIQGSSYTASTLSGSVEVACVLKQTAWPVTVEAGSSGTATVIGRYRKSDGAALRIGYLYADGSDYIRISVTPNDHFEETVGDRVVNNLEEYSAGGAYAYSLESELNGYIKFYFNRAECVIRTQIGNSGLPIPDANIIDNVLPQSTTRRYDAEDVTCLLSCTIKEQYDGLYRCDYWTVGGVQKPNEGASGTSMFYLTIYPTDWQNVTDLVCIPHLVSTSNQLTVTKSGRSDLATVYVKPSASEPEESMSGSSYSKLIREHAQVDIRAVAAFGGIVATPTYEDIENPDVTESSIGFQMPSNNCSVDFAVSERAKIQLGLQLANGTDNTLVGKIILTAPGSAAVHEEVFGTNQVIPFTIYQNTSYTLTATDDDDTYQFTGWYLNGSPVSEELSITISRSQNAVYVARYTMRASGTIGINYGIKSGDDVNPTELPEESSPFGLVIDTEPDQTNPDKWVIGRTKYISFHVTDNGIEEVAGTGPNSGIFIWTPVRVEVKEDIEADVYTTVWTYDELNPDARSGRFVMRNNMLVRTVYTRVKAEGQARVRALFMGGTNGGMGQLSIFSTNMPSYYSLGGEAEAVCATGRKVVLAASVKPGYAFVGWFEVVEGEFVPVESNGAILTVSSLSSQGCTYYAGFARSSSGVKAWNDDENPKVFEWRSKVYVGAQFFALRNLRIYSDVYPVTITLMTATSPNGCFTPSARTLTMQITSQSPRLIPVMRLEKYFAFKVNGTGRINHIAIASGMEALK